MKMLKNIIKMKPEILKNYLINELTKYGYKKIIYDNKNNYIIAHGEKRRGCL